MFYSQLRSIRKQLAKHIFGIKKLTHDWFGRLSCLHCRLNQLVLTNVRYHNSRLTHTLSMWLFISLTLGCCMQLIAKPVTSRSTISQALLIPPKASTESNQSNLYNVGFTSDSAAACSNRIGALCVATSNLINVMTGNTYQQETDFPALPGMMGIEIVRTYNCFYIHLW